MRATAMVAGAALVLAACGGKKDAGSADTTQPAATPPAATAPAGSGATDTIKMVMEGTAYKFVPENTTIKAGDNVVFLGVSGTGHDVAFIEDSIPPGAKSVLATAITGGPQDLSTAMINDGQSVSVSFAGAPAGVYHFYCIPHAPMGMRGSLTVQ